MSKKNKQNKNAPAPAQAPIDTPAAEAPATPPSDPAPEDDGTEGATDTDAPDSQFSALQGSSIQPATFDLVDGTTLSLGDIVLRAFEASEMTEEVWNQTATENPIITEGFIQDEVDKLELLATDDNPNDEFVDDAAEDDAPPEIAVRPPERTKPEGLPENEMKIRWIEFDRRKPLRVMQAFEHAGVEYERGQIFDWANLGMKPFAVRRLYNRKVVRHISEDARLRYPFRDEPTAPEKKAKAKKPIADNAPAEDKSTDQNGGKEGVASKFTRKNAHFH